MGRSDTSLRFGDFTLDLAERRLWDGDQSIDLGSRYFDALVLLAENAGQLVPKDRFMQEVWRGIPVTDEALTQAIRTLRRTLGDEASSPRFIETVPKHGYRFVAPVRSVTQASPDTPSLLQPASPAARLAGATTIGALLAGFLGGCFYGLFGTSGGVAGFATIVILTTALAALGGSGIGAGMALFSMWRGERDWSVIIGGAAGGIVVGALGSAIAIYGMHSLTGILPTRVTGMFEGLALGLAASASTVLAARFGLSRPAALLVAVVIGAAICGISAISGGNFYGATLVVLEEGFPASQLDLTALYRVLGPTGSAMIEGAVFASCVTLANWWASPAHARKVRK